MSESAEIFPIQGTEETQNQNVNAASETPAEETKTRKSRKSAKTEDAGEPVTAASDIHRQMFVIQQKMNAVKDARNEERDFDYRTEESIVNELKTHMAPFECVALFHDDIIAVSDRIYLKTVLSISNNHGQSIETTGFAGEDPAVIPGNKCLAQGTGSCSTYAHKYALKSLLLLSSRDNAATEAIADPDANGQGFVPAKPKPATAAEKPAETKAEQKVEKKTEQKPAAAAPEPTATPVKSFANTNSNAADATPTLPAFEAAQAKQKEEEAAKAKAEAEKKNAAAQKTVVSVSAPAAKEEKAATKKLVLTPESKFWPKILTWASKTIATHDAKYLKAQLTVAYEVSDHDWNILLTAIGQK